MGTGRTRVLPTESLQVFQDNYSYPGNSPHSIDHNIITWLYLLARIHRKYVLLIEHKAIPNKIGVLLAKILFIFIYICEYIYGSHIYIALLWIKNIIFKCVVLFQILQCSMKIRKTSMRKSLNNILYLSFIGIWTWSA